PSAMLSAVFLLERQKVLRLPQAARLVTYNPAQAVGLGKEYGALEVGKVADLIQVRVDRYGIPIVQRVVVQGEERLKRT
ncbi:MAG: amidohydrolase family protein, partial [Ktedonobacteraceae bacterium]|nr:amidohydrolase family protein [Ktedonobacteraceae bacterium]